MKKRIVPSKKSILISICLLFALGCNERYADQKGEKRATPLKKDVTLHLIGEALPPFDALREVTKPFTAKTGVKVEIHPFEFETALAKTQLDFAGNTANYDVIMGIYWNLGKYVENNEVVDITEWLADAKKRDPALDVSNFFKPVYDISGAYKGRMYGLPATAQTMFLWYRKDLFEHKGERKAFQEKYGYELPTPTANKPIMWKQYRDLAQFFTRKKGEKLAGVETTKAFYGTCLQAKRHPALWYEFSNYLYSFGGEIVSDKGEIKVNSKAVRDALEFYMSLREFSPPGTLNYTWDDALTAFQQGNVALTTMWFDATPALYDKASSLVVDKVGFGLIPIREGVDKRAAIYGGWGFYINADTKHKNEAFQLIQWLNRADVQLMWATRGGLPGTVSTFQNPEYLKIPYHAAERAALDNAVAWTKAPYSENLNSKAIEAISRVVSGQSTPNEALAWLEKEARKIVAGK